MLILTIETSTEKGLILLSENEKPIDFRNLPGGAELSKTLALQVKNLLNGKTPDAIGVGIGPGSYTGIRVGASLAKALAFGWNIPLTGFCSLEVYGQTPILIDARMGGFYALLEETPELIQPNDPRLLNLKKIRTPNPELIQKRIVSNAILEEAEPSPNRVAEICFKALHEGKIGPLELNYLSTP